MIQAQSLGLRYGSGPEILSDIDMDIAPGSFHFITGVSGAGKTSLLKLLSLTLRPTRGLLSLFGKDVIALPRRRLPGLRRRIGLVFQDFRLLDHLTVFDNVALPLRIAGLRLTDYADNVNELLSWVGLSDCANAHPSALSGGEQQRVATARAVIGKPDLLLADEPTGNVDDETAERLLLLFHELHRYGSTVLIATHHTRLISAVDAQVLHLEGGRLEIVS